MSTDTQKLRVLRARTDHDLLVLIQRELERGFALVDVATTRNSPLFAQAQKAFATATALLSRISGANDGERLRIEKQVKELGARLEQAPVCASMRSYPASFAS